jgi:hypothetical protein
MSILFVYPLPVILWLRLLHSGGCACRIFLLFHTASRWLRLPKPYAVPHLPPLPARHTSYYHAVYLLVAVQFRLSRPPHIRHSSIVNEKRRRYADATGFPGSIPSVAAPASLRWLRLSKPFVVHTASRRLCLSKPLVVSHRFAEAAPAEASYCFTLLRGGYACQSLSLFTPPHGGCACRNLSLFTPPHGGYAYQSFSLFHTALRRLCLPKSLIVSHCFAVAAPVKASYYFTPLRGGCACRRLLN